MNFFKDELVRMGDPRSPGLEEEEYWNASVAKGFSWDEGDDTIGMPDLRSETMKIYEQSTTIDTTII